MKFSMTGLEKGDLLIHDCLIEVNTWAGVPVHRVEFCYLEIR
jgi:hypothetical protein